MPKHIAFKLCVFGALSLQMSLPIKITYCHSEPNFNRSYIQRHEDVTAQNTLCHDTCSCMTHADNILSEIMYHQPIIIQKHPSFSACDTTHLCDINHYTCAHITIHVVFFGLPAMEASLTKRLQLFVPVYI